MSAPVPTTSSSPPAPDHDASGPTPRVSWGAAAAFLAFVAAFGAAIFTSIPSLAIGDDTTTTKAVGSVVGSILQNIAFVAVPLLILASLVGRRLTRRDVGLTLPAKAWKIPAYAAVALILYLLLSSGLGAILDTDGQEDSLPEDLGAKGSLAAGIAIGLAVTVCAPIGEEFLLRGVLYPGLRDSLARISPVWVAIIGAAVVDGLIFGLLHLAGTKAIFLPILMLFGAILCLLYQATGSLYACILLHATNNTIAIAVSLDWSVLGGLALWVSALSIITLLALAARALELRLPEPRPHPGRVAPR